MIKSSDKLVLKKPVKRGQNDEKVGQNDEKLGQVNFGPKIGTVPLKAGQLEGME